MRLAPDNPAVFFLSTWPFQFYSLCKTKKTNAQIRLSICPAKHTVFLMSPSFGINSFIGVIPSKRTILLNYTCIQIGEHTSELQSQR